VICEEILRDQRGFLWLWQFPVDNPNQNAYSKLAGEFLLWAAVELRFSQETVAKYRDCLRQVWIWWGEREVKEMTPQGLLSLKQTWISRDLSVSRQTSLLLALNVSCSFARSRRAVSSSSIRRTLGRLGAREMKSYT